MTKTNEEYQLPHLLSHTHQLLVLVFKKLGRESVKHKLHGVFGFNYCVISYLPFALIFHWLCFHFFNSPIVSTNNSSNWCINTLLFASKSPSIVHVEGMLTEIQSTFSTLRMNMTFFKSFWRKLVKKIGCFTLQTFDNHLISCNQP